MGKEVTTSDGYNAAQMCALDILAQINKHAGFENIYSLNHFDAYFQAAEGWDESPVVMNGASDLFRQVLEDKGRHSRAIFGVERLPRNFSIGITASFTLIN